jgi:hypothetical protein
MRPRDAKTHNKLLALRTDGRQSGDFWILLGTYGVTITAQRLGKESTAMITVPRSHFDKFVDWYMKDQKPRPRVAAKKGRTLAGR